MSDIYTPPPDSFPAEASAEALAASEALSEAMLDLAVQLMTDGVSAHAACFALRLTCLTVLAEIHRHGPELEELARLP